MPKGSQRKQRIAVGRKKKPLVFLTCACTCCSDTSSLALTGALRRFRLGEDRRISVVADLKRSSPTSPALPRVVAAYGDAGRRTDELLRSGIGTVMVNTNAEGWGGSDADLESAVAAHRSFKRGIAAASDSGPRNPEASKSEAADSDSGVLSGESRTAVIAKDLIIHPLQIAAAVERGADGVVLVASVSCV